MFQVGDRVVYGIHGVCDVTRLEDRVVDRKPVRYLVLEPVGQTGSQYLVPEHNQAAMAKLQRMLTKEELSAVLRSDTVLVDAWIRDEGQRKQAYRELIGSGDRIRLMQMVRSLYRHKSEQAAAGRKVHLCDDNFLRDAEKLLASEVAVVMELEPEEARRFLRETLRAE